MFREAAEAFQLPELKDLAIAASNDLNEVIIAALREQVRAEVNGEKGEEEEEEKKVQMSGRERERESSFAFLLSSFFHCCPHSTNLRSFSTLLGKRRTSSIFLSLQEKEEEGKRVERLLSALSRCVGGGRHVYPANVFFLYVCLHRNSCPMPCEGCQRRQKEKKEKRLAEVPLLSASPLLVLYLRFFFLGLCFLSLSD